MGLKFLSDYENIHNEANYGILQLASNITILKNAKIVCSVDKYKISTPSFITLIKQCIKLIRGLSCCKQTVNRVSESALSLFFFARPIEGVISDRVL